MALVVKGFKPIYVDFSSFVIQKRRQDGKKQGLIRACKPAQGVKIIDATAGWGRDASLLASFGAEVQMIERNPIMAALLKDGLNRLEGAGNSSSNLSLLSGDTTNYLLSLTHDQYPDIIYLDPMHPERKKAALVKKDLQILQDLIGADLDAGDLLTVALKRAKQRVVVKWPQKLQPLQKPNLSYEGKTVRFDVYIT